MRRLIAPLIFGLFGAVVLIALGTWQVQRLQWKQSVLADIQARIDAPAVALPSEITPDQDRYLPVAVRGHLEEPTLRVLVSHRTYGAGYRLISALDMDGRRILVDRGFVANEAPRVALPDARVEFTGNLHWPQERDGFTPDNDLEANIWFARDVPAMAAALNTQEVLVIARTRSFEDGPVIPLPVGIEGIPNDHLEYVVTWYGLAAVWLVMLGLFLWRMYKTTRKPAKGD
ncbi:MAG: SURF1 family protein [Thalassovita sp.]